MDLITTIEDNDLQTSYYFEWGTDSNLAGALKSQIFTASPSYLYHSYSLNGLTPSTKYYCRLVASSSAGTSYSGIGSFTTGTPEGPPTVQTLAATSVTQTTATINASVIPNGLATTAHFEWSTDSAFILNVATTPAQNIGAGMTSVSINAPLSGLSSSTQYFYRAVAVNSAGPSPPGDVSSFFTLAQNPPPTVQTINANPIGVNSATLNGSVNPNGLATTAYFRWGTDPSLTVASNTASQAIGSGTAAVNLTASLSGLTASTTYYYKVVATNSVDTSQGDILPFTTQTQSGVTWAARNSGTAFGLAGVVYGGGQFVVVGLTIGVGGYIQTSADGITWTSRNSGTISSLQGVTDGGEQFVAIGYSTGVILTSPDGIAWTTRGSNSLWGITYGNGLFVTVGTSGAILTSPDGINWTLQNSGTYADLFGVTYGGGKFVAVGIGSTILTSN